MLKSTEGFTLIELVVVIVIIGILAIIAVPKYIDMSSSAQTAAANGVAGALSSGSAVNYAANTAVTCTIIGPSRSSASFIAIGIP